MPFGDFQSSVKLNLYGHYDLVVNQHKLGFVVTTELNFVEIIEVEN